MYNVHTLKAPFNMMVSGPTQSGKTTLVKKLMRFAPDMIDRPPRKIVYCYGSEWQDTFDTMHDVVDDFIEGIPERETSDLFPPHARPGLIVLDDLMNDVKDSDRVVKLFTKGTHHCDVNAIYIAQNPFPGGKHGRTMSLNTHYNILTKNPRDCLGVETLFRQMFPRKGREAMDAYNQAVDRPYGYLFIDQHQTTPDAIRLQTCIFPDEAPRECYILDESKVPEAYLNPAAIKKRK